MSLGFGGCHVPTRMSVNEDLGPALTNDDAMNGAFAQALLQPRLNARFELGRRAIHFATANHGESEAVAVTGNEVATYKQKSAGTNDRPLKKSRVRSCLSTRSTKSSMRTSACPSLCSRSSDCWYTR